MMGTNSELAHGTAYGAVGLAAPILAAALYGWVCLWPAQATDQTVVGGAEVTARDSRYTFEDRTVLTVTPALGEAVDAPHLTWTTGGHAPWIAQTNVTYDGVDAAQSGLISDNDQTWMETTVTGPGILSFWWKVSSEEDWDYLEFYINGVLQSGRISGEVGWQQRSFSLGVGAQTLRWRYVKDDSVTAGQDRGWVDAVTFVPPGPPTIVTQPASQTVAAGSPVTFSVVATGATPLSYQWRKESVAIPGATNASYTLANVQTNDAGHYSVVVTNALGSVTSSNAVLTVVTLGEAVDAPHLTWSTGGHAPWFGQTNMTYDRVDAAQSGTITHNQETWMETTVTGPGILSFWWKVSSEEGWDYLGFYINGALQSDISGEVAWQQQTFSLGAGTHTLRWRYRKDSVGTAGQDRGWVDAVTFVPPTGPPTIVSQPASQTVFAGSPVTFSVVAGGTTPLSYQWRKEAVAIPGATNASYTLANVHTNDAGNYSVVVTNALGWVTSSNAVLTVIPVLSLGEAVDAPHLTWTTGGHAPWFGQPAVTYDGVDAAQSGTITGWWQETWMETTVTGPGILSFWWMLRSREVWGYLEFYINGVWQRRIFWDWDWEQPTFSLGAGTQRLRWRYSKHFGGTAGQDRGWVDAVTFVPTGPPTIVTQPASQTVFAGSPVTFSVVASGATPLSYQWRKKGVPIPGATNASYTLASVQTNDAGHYSVVVTNALGSVTSSNAVLTVSLMVPLAEAVDAPHLAWSTGGHAPWIGQPAVTYDGVDAAQSGTITHNQETWMETTVVGPGILSFWWKVSSESGCDWLEFYINGVLQSGRISGEVAWQQRSFSLGAGTQRLRWRYIKNGSVTAGQDRGWLDAVTFVPSEPPTILTQPASQTVFAGSPVTFSVVASGTPPLSYQWRKEAAAIPGATNASYTLASVQTNDAGHYSVVVTNALGWVTSSKAVLTVVTLGEAVDAPHLTWTTGGHASWFGQTNMTYDGVDAAQSGTITHNQETWMETTVTGPGILSFWWKVSSEEDWDYLEFYINGVLQSDISGEVAWQQQTFSLGAGTQRLRWRYIKNGSVTAGQDRGWVDAVTFVPGEPPIILRQPASQTVVAGLPVTFSVVAIGSAPLSYQWHKESVAIPGATNASYTLASVQTDDAGHYSVVVTNALGWVTSSKAVLTVIPVLSLGEAVDAPHLTWTTDGHAPWTGQPAVAYDGVDAAQSGAITHNQETWMETTVTGPGILSFWWKVSSEEDWDYLEFYINGVLQSDISGEVAWQQQTFSLGAGRQTLRWRYIKNGSVTAGQDRGWVDAVSFVPSTGPPTIVTQPASQTVVAGLPVTFSVVAIGSAPLSYQWRKESVAIPGATNASYTLANAQPNDAGNYSVLVTNWFGAVTSAPAWLRVLEPPRITEPPQPRVVAVGQELELTVTAVGTEALRYYWRRNGVLIPEAHEPILRLPAVRPEDSGTYSVTVQNELGAVTSPEVPVLVLLPVVNLQDMFTNQVEVLEPMGVGRASNRGAGAEPGEPEHYGKLGGRSVWLGWRAMDDGVVTFRTSGSGFDTLLAAYVGPTVDRLTEVASDDDSGGFLCSQIRFNAVRGMRYHIALDGFNGQEGDIVLSWTFEPEAEPLPVIVQHPHSVLTSLSNTVTFSVVATQAMGWSYLWFHNGQPLALGRQPELTILNAQPADAGVYFVRLIRGDQYLDSRPALLQLSVVEPDGPVATNLFADKLADAARGLAQPEGVAPAPKPPLSAQALIRGYTGSQVFNTYGAVSEPGEPVHCGVVGGASVWYYYIAPTNGTLSLDTIGSNYDTILAVYTGPGTEFATLQGVACDNNSGPDGRTSRVNFPVTAGTVYFIAVDGVNGATGTLRLNYRLLLSMVLTQQVATAGVFSFQVHATPDAPFTLQRSHDLINWISLLTTSTPTGTFTHWESNIVSRPKRFYRTVQNP